MTVFDHHPERKSLLWISCSSEQSLLWAVRLRSG